MRVKVWVYRPDLAYRGDFNPDNFYDSKGISCSEYLSAYENRKAQKFEMPYKKDYQIEVPNSF